MEARGEYGEIKTDGEAILEGDRRTAKGEEKSHTEIGVRGMFAFDQGVLFLRKAARRCLE
jgi:hypothetical protein